MPDDGARFDRRADGSELATQAHSRKEERGGHWWTWTDDDAPEWYRNTHEEITSPAGRGEQTDAGRLPPEISWSDLAAYRCRHCSDDCINERGTVYVETEQCRTCYDLPALEDESADRATGVSPGEASRVSGASGANASASGEPAGSDPLRVDPEAGAHARSEARAVPDGGERQ